MIRIRYNDGIEVLYEKTDDAKVDLLTVLVESRGQIRPVLVSEVLEVYEDGVSIERELSVRIRVDFDAL